MVISHHHLDKTEIIGIGPLMFQSHPDTQVRMLYNIKQLWFYLHLRHQSFKIESDWFDMDIEKQREAYSKFTIQYEEDKAAVLALISEREVDLIVS